MLEEGKSWSGRERNVAYLNTRDGRFTDISTIAGWAYDSDSRALGLTDWDGDGDIDVWQANRSAPRVRLLLNQSNAAVRDRALQIRLAGNPAQTNRDAIGARVELTLSTGQKLVKTLRAGEGYLSQSSKTLHFGIPPAATIASTSVRWPGDEKPTTYSNIAPGHHHQIQQNGHVTKTALTKGRPALNGRGSGIRDTESMINAQPIRLVPHAKLPLPQLSCFGFDGAASFDASTHARPTLVVLWASWCQPCLHEIRSLSESEAQLRQAGIDVLLLNVDEEPKAIDSVPDHFRQGAASKPALDAIDATQRVIAARERSTALPLSFLCDPERRLLALYKGAVTAEQVVGDLTLAKTTSQDFRNAAVPFPGNWLIVAMPADLLSIPDRLAELGQTRLAFDYLESHVTGSRTPSPNVKLPSIALTIPEVSRRYARLASQFTQSSQMTMGERAYIRSLQYQPRDVETRAELALHYERQGQLDKAATQFRQLLKLQPQHLPAQNSLAWILATAPDAKVRNPQEAQRLAQNVCQATQFAMHEPLDTLAAAQAAGRQFDAAVATLQRALALDSLKASPDTANKLRSRLALYQKRQPYIQSQ